VIYSVCSPRRKYWKRDIRPSNDRDIVMDWNKKYKLLNQGDFDGLSSTFGKVMISDYEIIL